MAMFRKIQEAPTELINRLFTGDKHDAPSEPGYYTIYNFLQEWNL
jgi:hypothetical protein